MLGQLQRIGKALMLPIAVLPVAGLLLRLGQPDTLNIPFMAAAGNAVFNFLPAIFAIGIAVGLAKDNHGLAGLAGFVAFQVLSYGSQAIHSDNNLSYLGAIVAGLLTGWLFNLFSRARVRGLDFLAGGRGLAVILITLTSVMLSLVFGVVWPFVQDAFNTLGHWLAATGAVGAGLYGLLNRLLIPFGLHHVINTYIWFVYGSYHGVSGDLNRFFAGDPTAGGYMAGFFPIMMFGLPGAALAMILAARPERRQAVAGVLGSAAFTAFLTGVTEPIEFAFMFLAPLLFVLHAVLTGLTLMVVYALGIRDGFTFSAGLIDYILNRNHATHGWWLIPIGLVVGVLYFVVFYFSIRIFDIKTPGRELEGAGTAGGGFILDEYQVGAATSREDEENTTSIFGRSSEHRALEYVRALGGAENILEIEACTTRLRLNVKDVEKIDELWLKQLGASGVMKLNRHNAQIVVGTIADLLVDEIKPLL
ncbi:PTS acetylglucosamine transporter subunit IIB [Alicyclobacillus contaminans]|uniref:PTS transporter subunit EIIC n=1 Tax=Alicyclobacillus contaminans TaxID=392016 RepID=UPI0004262778|nr:PTS transporter subunit EIIC [Alicyclobacillus contaminans]GMA51608.1 PTS acetylglucosamine transporter subunit IIB [Alicyclobacillus contaminans]